MAPTARRTIEGKLIESKMRGRLLAAGGHVYSVNLKRPGARNPVINWRCLKNKECVGTAKTAYMDLEATPINTNVEVTLMKEHLHDPDSAEILVRETVNEIRRRAECEPNIAPLRIIQTVTNPINNPEILVRLPERQTLARGVNRAQNRSRPSNPHNLAEFHITHPYDRTLGDELFLQLDTTLTDGTHLIMLYTENDLRRLCASGVVFADGTYRSVPRCYKV